MGWGGRKNRGCKGIAENDGEIAVGSLDEEGVS